MLQFFPKAACSRRRSAAGALQRRQAAIEIAVIAAIFNHPAGMCHRRAIALEHTADRRETQAEAHMREIDGDLPGECRLRRAACRHQQGALIESEITCHAQRDEPHDAFGR
jgi:hypothetical protein